MYRSLAAGVSLLVGASVPAAARSAYTIVVPARSAGEYAFAAEEMRDHLQRIGGQELAIVTDDRGLPEKAIVLGPTRHAKRALAGVDLAALGRDGYVARTIDGRLFITGAGVTGTLNGVYSFLEQHMGCRWYTPDCTITPKQAALRLPKVDETYNPVVKWRDVYYRAVGDDPAFALRLRLNGSAELIDGHPAKSASGFAGWGNWCHSLHSYVSPEQYFEAHPEYFAFRDGKRQPLQLCLTNPEVLRLTIESLGEKMRANPEAYIWDVSQMDGGGNCQCDECKALDEREGGPMGTVLAFVNAIARAYPDMTISTLSYYYSQHATKTIKPEPNVIIKLCAYGLPCHVPYEGNAFAETVRQWSAMCKRMCIWDYDINFAHLLAPHPNFRTMQPNLRFFIAHGVESMFAQCNREVGGEWHELRAYVLAKLLWNPECDADAVVDDFMAGYYGAAAEPIRRYFDTMHEELAASGKDLNLYCDPASHAEGFLRPELLDRYSGWFDEAEQLVADDAALLARVRRARLPLMYAELYLKHGTPGKRLPLLTQFCDQCEADGIGLLSEIHTPPAEFRTKMTEAIKAEMGG